MDCSLPGSSLRGNFPGNNTGVGSHFLLQEIFLTQGSNSGLQHDKQILHHLSHQGSLCILWDRWYSYYLIFQWMHPRLKEKLPKVTERANLLTAPALGLIKYFESIDPTKAPPSRFEVKQINILAKMMRLIVSTMFLVSVLLSYLPLKIQAVLLTCSLLIDW